MRVAHHVLRSAAAAGIVSLAAACVIPPPGVSPRPEEDRLPAPDVSFYSFDQAPYGAGSDVLTYSTTRDAYTAAFEVDQTGRVRVLTPASPRDAGRSSVGTSYVLYPMLHSVDRDFLSTSTDFSRVPYVFVLTSDTPLDLSAFGTGKSWSHDLTIGARSPDSAIAQVAQRVLADAPAYGSDFAYVGPLLRAGERQFTAQCARPVEDVHDYNYYRDLWAVFTPADQRLSINPNWLYSPGLSWSSYATLPLAAYRADLARAAFYPGCTAQQYAYASGVPGYFGYGGYGLPGSYYGNGLWTGSYRYGVPTIGVAQTPPARAVPGLHVPRIPTAWGPVQAPGTATPAVTSALALWRTPGRVTLPTTATRTPGEVTVAERWAIGQPHTAFVRPVERHAFEHQPNMGPVASTNAYRSGPQSHPIPNGQYGQWQGRSQPMSNGSSGNGSTYSGGGQWSHSPAYGTATSSSTGASSAGASSGGASSAAPAQPVAHSSGSAKQQ